jgi:probable F420-dependent oxidoreductase
VATTKIGAILPTLDLADGCELRDFAQAAEDLGFSHIVTWEHVMGVDATHHPEWQGAGTLVPIHEPFVLFGYLAAVTHRVDLVTGVMVLPQRQTALLAKQAAEVDNLSEGRLRLGVGVGWVEPEFRALNEGWTDRGRRCDEQIAVLRALFTQKSVIFDGSWHHIHGMGISPLPVQRPIPIWVGGEADASLRRVALLGDGWMSPVSPDEAERGHFIERLDRYIREAGRDPASVGVEAIVSIGEDLHPEAPASWRTPDQWRHDVDRWRALGASHLSFNSMGVGLSSTQAHIDAIRQFMDAIR